MAKKFLIVLMGVSASGKTEVGKYLQQRYEIPFTDGDDLHPPANVEKMSAGVALDDHDREPWLKKICEHAETNFADGRSVAIACSALKKAYRDTLRSVSGQVKFLFLSGRKKEILKRLEMRAGHYMPVSLLDSQFDTLEDPTGEPDVISINIEQELEQVLAEVTKKLEPILGV